MSIDSISSGLSSISAIPASGGASQDSGVSFDSFLSPGLTSEPVPQNTRVDDEDKTDPAVTNFTNYMKESPVQRYLDAWLAAHHLTEDDLKNMTPEKRAAVMKAIAQDMQRNIEDETKKKTGSMLSLSA